MNRSLIVVMLILLYGVTNGFSMGRGMEFGPPPKKMNDRGGYGGQMEFFWADFSDPEVRKMLDNYRNKMDEVFLESRKERNSLQTKRRELFFKLRDLKDKYKNDKTVGKEIVKTMREINEVTEKLQDINQQTMDKLRKLNEERRKEFSAYSKKWIDSLEKDEAKLEQFLKKVDEYEVNRFGRPGKKGYFPPDDRF